MGQCEPVNPASSNRLVLLLGQQYHTTFIVTLHSHGANASKGHDSKSQPPLDGLLDGGILCCHTLKTPNIGERFYTL